MEHVEQIRFGDLDAMIERASFHKLYFYSPPELSPPCRRERQDSFSEAAPSKIKIKGPAL